MTPRPNPRYANGHRRRALRERLRSLGLPCALCGKPIDYSLPAGHPMSFEVDEIVPVSLGGDPFEWGNVQPAHRTCNQRKSNHVAPRNGKAVSRAAAVPQSRDWFAPKTDGSGGVGTAPAHAQAAPPSA